jgi:hypothetical protein
MSYLSDRIVKPAGLIRVYAGAELHDVPAKHYGENIVPFGCYYDDYERQSPTLNFIDDVLFTLLSKMEESIINYFSITNNDILYEAMVDRANAKNISLVGFRDPSS